MFCFLYFGSYSNMLCTVHLASPTHLHSFTLTYDTHTCTSILVYNCIYLQHSYMYQHTCVEHTEIFTYIEITFNEYTQTHYGFNSLYLYTISLPQWKSQLKLLQPWLLLLFLWVVRSGTHAFVKLLLIASVLSEMQPNLLKLMKRAYAV